MRSEMIYAGLMIGIGSAFTVGMLFFAFLAWKYKLPFLGAPVPSNITSTVPDWAKSRR